MCVRCAPCRIQPRYWQARTPLSAFHVASSSGDVFLNDALLRALTHQLGLAQCAVLLTAGEPCSSSLEAAPCPDPMWLCSGGSGGAAAEAELTISNSVYQAAASGLCGTSSASAAAAEACATLRSVPAIEQLVANGSCTPACFAQLSGSGDAKPSIQPSSLPPTSGACFSFWLQTDAASEAGAQAAASNLHNATTAGALQDALANFSAPDASIQFDVGASGACVFCVLTLLCPVPHPTCSHIFMYLMLWCRHPSPGWVWLLPAAATAPQPSAALASAPPAAAAALSAAPARPLPAG